MSNKRKSLKKLAGISAAVTILPNAWVKPAINSVVLPAHAQTTQTTVAPTTVGPTTTATPAVTYTITSGVFDVEETGNSQTNFFSASGTMTASNGVIPTGQLIQLDITLSPNGETYSNFLTVAANGTFTFPFGTQQFLATGNTTATGIFSFTDQATYGSSTFTATDSALTPP